MRLFRVLAWFDNWVETAALSSAAAELASMTLETSLILFYTDTIISDCCMLAEEISSMSILMD